MNGSTFRLLKVRVKQVLYEPKIFWQHKKAKAERKSASDLKNWRILSDNLPKGLGSRRALLGLLSMRIHPEMLPHLSRKRWRSWIIVVTWLRSVSTLHANNSSPEVYWRKRPNWWAYLELCHSNPDILERVLNQILLSNSTAGKCEPMQVTKQPEHGRTSTTKE